jgi:transposase-like protein
MIAHAMSSTQFNIKDAAKLYGMSRNTIYKALSEGRLSKNATGLIDFVELLRVFGEPTTKHMQNTGGNSAENTTEHEKTQQEQSVAQQSKSKELTYALREMQLLRTQLEESKIRESFYQSQLLSLTETIKKLEPPPPEVKSEPVGVLDEVSIEEKQAVQLYLTQYGIYYIISLLVVIGVMIAWFVINISGGIFIR